MSRLAPDKVSARSQLAAPPRWSELPCRPRAAPAASVAVSLRTNAEDGNIGGQEATEMRHLAGFVLAIVLAVAIFFGATWGYLRLLRVPVVNGAAATLPASGGSLLHERNVLLAFAALAGVGLLAGICVAAPRISPLAAGLPGLGLLGWTALYLASVGRAVRYIPLKADAFGDGFEAMLINGVLAFAGFVMIIPLFIPSRWRPAALPVYLDPGEDLTTPAGTGTGSSVLLTNDWGNQTAPIEQPGDQPTDQWS